MFTCSHLRLQAHEITSLHGLDSKRPIYSCLQSQVHEIRSLHGLGNKRLWKPFSFNFGCFLQGEGVTDVATDACYIYFLGVFYKERVLVMLQRMHATSIFCVLFTRRGCYWCYNICMLHLFLACFLQGEGVIDVTTDACYIYFLGAFHKERMLVMLQRMHATSIFWVLFTRREC